MSAGVQPISTNLEQLHKDDKNILHATEDPMLDTRNYTLHSQGAEARVWEGTFLNRPTIVKQRFKKRYRHPTLDNKLTSSRLRLEVRSMLKARKLGVPTPTLYHVDVPKACIYMEKINGHSLKTVLMQLQNDMLSGNDIIASKSKNAAMYLVRLLGTIVATLHDGNIIHGDLTTSNSLVVPRRQSTSDDTACEFDDRSLIMIDFGLSYLSGIPEDKAVDLYVLERAFTSAHAAKGDELFAEFLESYRKSSRNWCSTLNKFADVRMRGRKRSMVG